MAKKVRNALVDSIVDGIQDRKGTNITILDMRDVDSAICEYFIICDGTSSTHVDSISDSIEDKVKEQLRENPLHVEGRANATWILLDYHSVIVHIFQRQTREFYALESLWSDAKRTDLPNID